MTEDTKGWTAERRQAQRERILALKPWEKSTGPKSRIGKSIASQNALKHGNHSRQAKTIKALLKDSREYLKNYRLLHRYTLEQLMKYELENKLKESIAKSTRSYF